MFSVFTNEKFVKGYFGFVYIINIYINYLAFRNVYVCFDYIFLYYLFINNIFEIFYIF